MTKYEELQLEHRRLLEEYEAKRGSRELLQAAQAYIERARVEAEAVSSPRDRDQLRANLRFWASFVYEKTDTYPETALRPALQAASPHTHQVPWYQRRRLELAAIGATIIIILALLMTLVSYEVSAVFSNIASSLSHNHVPTPTFTFTTPASTLTATSTPSPSATPAPYLTNTPVIRPHTPSPAYGISPTASPTRSKYPFTAEIVRQVSPHGCNWAGLMGVVYNLEGKPLSGYVVHVQGDTDIDKLVLSGSSQFKNVPGYGESAWDVPINASGLATGTWSVRLYQPGTSMPLSEEYQVRLEQTCGLSSVFIKFVCNHCTPLQPTSAHTPTPTPASANGNYLRTQLEATVSAQPHPQGCAGRAIDIALDVGKLISATELTQATVQISRAGSGEVISPPQATSRQAISLNLSRYAPTGKEAFLVQVNHPTLTASSVIVQFTNDCERNWVKINYQAKQALSNLESEPARNPNLSLDWRLTTWGPSPFGSNWVAVLTLQAKGGDGHYVFWADGQPLADNRITLQGHACAPARKLVGVSSGGQAVLRELALTAPCP